ncbi:TonB-dependent receptor [Sphingopyxis sp. J-6]|uniref:TonB-dependent receptor n=1 Tax=Sphingopyxis sp. J-6 TaxID=3122054 RepID=UPI0039844B6C
MATHLFSTTSIAAAMLLAAEPASAAEPAPPAESATSDAQAAGQGDDGISDIIVTARRKEERMQTVPVAVSAVTQEQIAGRGNFEVTDLKYTVPGLNASEGFGGSRNQFIFTLRGQSQAGGTLFPAVVTYFAEVPVLKLNRGQFFDLESVQVLRGPQGTLFGRVTDGGNVMVAPQRPVDRFEGYVEAKTGSYDLRGVAGAINIPLVPEKLLLRGAFDVNRRDGYTRNVGSGQKLDDVHYDSARISLLFKPTDEFENTLIYNYNSVDENGTSNKLNGFNPLGLLAILNGPAFSAQMQADLAAQQALGPRAVNIGSPVWGDNYGLYSKAKNHYVINKTIFNINDNLQIKNVLAYVYFKNHYGSDFDGSSLVVVDVPNLYHPDPEFYKEQWSEDLQIQGTAFDGTLNYTLGTYWDWQKVPGEAENFSVSQLGIPLQRLVISYPKTRSRAVYGQIGYDLSSLLPGLKLDAGLRYTKDSVKASFANYLGFAFTDADLSADAMPHGQCVTNLADYPTMIAVASVPCTRAEQSSSAVTGTFGFSYQIDPRKLIYAKVSRGYRPGGINTVSTGGVVPTYSPEYDLSFEVGAKLDYNIGSMRARTNIAAYTDRFTDIQANVNQIGPGGVAAVIITNAAEARIKGIELEQTLVPFEGMTLNATWAYTNARYLNKLSPSELETACPSNPLTNPIAGIGFCPLNPLPSTPKHMVNLAAQYSLPLPESVGEVTIGGSLYYRSEFPEFFTLPGQRVAPLTLLNLDVTWKRVFGSRVDATLFATNVTNKTYIVQPSALLAASSYGISTATYGEPRMWGLKLRYSFGAE